MTLKMLNQVKLISKIKIILAKRNCCRHTNNNINNCRKFNNHKTKNYRIRICKISTIQMQACHNLFLKDNIH